MCGRYLRRSDKQRIVEYFRVHGVPPFPLPADYNVAPTTHQPVIRLNGDSGGRELVLMRWGLVPVHALSLADYKGVSTINARAENVQHGMWKRLFERRRCLVPVDGFYEWHTSVQAAPGNKRKPKTTKKPYAFTLRNDLPFALAGLWDAWQDRSAPEETERVWLESFAVITTDANEVLAPVHNRMPVILEPKDYDRWLDCSAQDRPPLDLLRAYAADQMHAAPANPLVGNAKNNGPQMLCADEAERPREAAMLFDGLRQGTSEVTGSGRS